MTDPPRAVFDTNVFVSAFLSRNPSSPTKELLERWKAGEFVLLISDALADELGRSSRDALPFFPGPVPRRPSLMRLRLDVPGAPLVF